MGSRWGLISSLLLSATMLGTPAFANDNEDIGRKIVRIEDDSIILGEEPSLETITKYRALLTKFEMQKVSEQDFDLMYGNQWNEVGDGLYLGGFLPSKDYSNGQDVRDELDLNYPIVVLKIDLDQYDLKLFSQSELNDKFVRDAEEWAREFDLIATINAGMYHQDYETNAGYMRNFDYVNSPGTVGHYRSVLSFNPKSEQSPEARIFDLGGQGSLRGARNQYNTVIQGLRMITGNQNNAWGQSSRIWSTAAFGFDKEGNALMIHSRTPYSVHDFNDIILSIPELNVQNLQYCEGGPESSLFIKVGDSVLRSVGSYETNFTENDDNQTFWNLPNVIGVVPKTE